jgi:membrane fusion protein, multidrug efflux system
MHFMSKSKIAGLIGIVAFSLVVLSGCTRKQEKPQSAADIQKREGIPVTVMTISRGDLEAVELAGGTIEGYQQSVLSASIPAVISSIRVSVGQAVEKDAVLITLDPNSTSPYAIAQAGYQSTEKSLERTKALAEQGGVSQDVVDQLNSAYAIQKAGLEGARKMETILAPFAGTIVELNQPVYTVASPGKALVKIAALGRIRVKMNISEALIDRYKTGQKAIIETDTDTLPGKVEKVSLAADESNHIFIVETVFDNTKRKFKPGMYVAVKVVVDKRPSVLSLPMETVIAEGVEKYVYTVENGVARKAPLTVGIRGGDHLEILSGLTDNAVVVTSGASLLSDGLKVKIVQ